MKPLLYVDGYNVIGAWNEVQKENLPLDECRDRLIHLMEDYAGYTDQEVWLVFDGYRTERPLRTVEPRRELTVVYTRHGETADQYIEALADEIGSNYAVRVASSDALVQLSSFRTGVLRMSARELREEIDAANRDMEQYLKQKNRTK